MNGKNTSDVQRMNVRAHQRLYPTLICKSLWKDKNMNMKRCEIILYIINNHKGVLQIWKSVPQILKAL